jgi:type II secretory pathway component PulM
MIGLSRLSSREKKMFAVVAGAIVVVLIDLAFRSWGMALAGMEREEKRLRAQRDYAVGLLARSQNIEERYSGLRARFPTFFEDGRDPARLMAELDEVAKAAGVQVNMIRPAGSNVRIEMALRGSWSQVMRFFQAVEDQEHLFQLSVMSVHLQKQTGELDVSLVAQK